MTPMTERIDGLVHLGFINRQPHPSVRRASTIAQTTKGVATSAWLTSSPQDSAITLFEESDAGSRPSRRT